MSDVLVSPGGRAAVTGGAGFIGSNIVDELLRGGWVVTILDDLSSGDRRNLPRHERATFVEGDVRDRTAVRKAIAGCDVVFHLAASVGNKKSIDDPVRDAETNVLGTINVLEEARAAAVRKIVVSSSAGVFGELKTLPIREDHPLDPDSPYGCTKLCEEKLALAWAKLHGLEAVCLRYFNVFGRRQRFDAYGNVIPIFVFKALRGERLTVFGDGEQTRDFVHVRDVVAANLGAAMRQGLSGVFNIGSGSRISINELVRLIGDVSGLTLDVTHGPERPGDVRHSLADIAAAREAFGFSPSPAFRENLADYVAWAKGEAE
ncbi:MAG: NAD-dependent epimerase/dehydratase family protein [Thermoanaerobaculia bacterium]